MKTNNILIAGTLTLNIGLAVALAGSNPDFKAMFVNNTPAEESVSASKPGGLKAPPPVLRRSPETQAYILDTVRANPQAVLDALLFLQASGDVNLSDTQSVSLPQYSEEGELGADSISNDMDIESTENAFVGGNPDGDVTVVQFFDYNCEYCRKAAPVVHDVVKQDGNVRLIYREYPILTPGSAYAARASLAAREQGLYEEFHVALMDADAALEEPLVLEIAQAVGLDTSKLQNDMNNPRIIDHLRTSQDLADMNGIKGTPTFSINGVIAAGAPSVAKFQRALDDARDK